MSDNAADDVFLGKPVIFDQAELREGDSRDLYSFRILPDDADLSDDPGGLQLKKLFAKHRIDSYGYDCGPPKILGRSGFRCGKLFTAIIKGFSGSLAVDNFGVAHGVIYGVVYSSKRNIYETVFISSAEVIRFLKSVGIEPIVLSK